MRIEGHLAVVTGGASGLGRATAQALVARGARVVLVDVDEQALGAAAGALGAAAIPVPADVTDDDAVAAAFEVAGEHGGPRVVIHCAGRGGLVRVLDRDGAPGSRADFEAILRVNLVGTFNVLRHGAAAMVDLDPLGEERGVFVLTSSIAAYEGQIGQIGYAASKAGVVGLTLTAARDLAARRIRVCTIAPGVFDTAILDRLTDELKAGLAAAIPHPSRLGQPDEFAALAVHVVENPMLNGETIRLDGAIRMAAR